MSREVCRDVLDPGDVQKGCAKIVCAHFSAPGPGPSLPLILAIFEAPRRRISYAPPLSQYAHQPLKGIFRGGGGAVYKIWPPKKCTGVLRELSVPKVTNRVDHTELNSPCIQRSSDMCLGGLGAERNEGKAKKNKGQSQEAQKMR